MKGLIAIFVIMTFWGRTQSEVGIIFEELPLDSFQYTTVKAHTSVKPFIRQTTTIQSKDIVTKKNNLIRIAPMFDLNGAYRDSLAFRTGLGVKMELVTKKWYARIASVTGVGMEGSVFSTNSFYKEPKNNLVVYSDVRGRISYTPNEIFNFQLGLDNNFIGEGNRSLFLSDYSVPYPFAQIRTRFWRVEYTIMYQFFREKFQSNYRSKYGATHHISLNATKWLNIGIFESVTFQPKDTLLNRGFDAEYLNPVIFYRPQEYSLGSSDNVLIGLSIDAHFNKSTFYSQFILDEFNLGEIRAKTGWWANKFGIQAGYKSFIKTAIGALFYRVEYNFVRPYTYAHIDEMHNYGHQSTTLAHPLGSNFHEILGELKWQKGKWLGKIFASYTLQGLNKDTLNYGANIYEPYINRPSDYGNFTSQGLGRNSFLAVFTIDYQLLKSMNLHCFIESHVRYSSLINSVNYFPVVGVRSQLWNDYRNY